jgi:hypothetical protein
VNPGTEKLLCELERAVWFRNVGVNSVRDISSPNNWQEAIDSCESLQWENTQLHAANDIRDRMRSESIQRYDEWNDIVAYLKPRTEPLAIAKTMDVIRENNLPKVFLDSVRWDILHLCIESEYADCVEPGFYHNLGLWYVRGNFPCGWEGKFPEGSLIVY